MLLQSIGSIRLLRKLILKSTQTKFVKNIGVLVGGTALSQIALIAFSPVLTRLYSPDQWGVLAAYAAVLALLTVIASLKYELAIPLADSEEKARSVLVLCFAILLGLSLLVALLLVFAGEVITSFENYSQLAPYLGFLPVGMILVGSYQIFNYWAIRQEAFKAVAATKFSQSLAQIILQGGLGLLSFGALGLILGQIAGQATGLTSLIRATWKRSYWKISIKTLSANAKRYRRFPLLSSWSGFLNAAGLQLPILLMTSFYGLEVAGLFGLSERMTRLPISIVGQSISQVFMSQASKLRQEDPQALKRLFWVTTKRLTILALPSITALFFIAPWLFETIFGEQWLIAGRYTQALCLLLLGRFITLPLSQTLNILERQDLQLKWDILRFVMIVLSLVIPNTLNWSALNALWVYSSSSFLSYVLLFLFYLKALQKVAV